jgi:hypothetical protein
MRPNDPSRRLLQIQRQLADLAASPRDAVVMFDIRVEGLRALERILLLACEEEARPQVAI